jgi:hypothetical protein
VSFYRDVLGMRLVFEAPANPCHGRHAMISPGDAGMGLHSRGVPLTPVLEPDRFAPGCERSCFRIRAGYC